MKYANNPVFTKGTSNWDIIAVGQPTCIIENDTIKMWYVAVGNDMKARISYAWSLNGINWTKYNNASPVLDVGTSGQWDDKWLDAPGILKSTSGYFLYYGGDTAQQSPDISSAYGVATSADGINWTRYSGNPVLQKGGPSDFDGGWLESPAAYFNPDDSTYMLWYSGKHASNWIIKNGLATSVDGLSWTKYPNNPVTDVGASGSFDDMWVVVPAVIKTDDVFEMWYCGFSSSAGFDTVRIGYAVSLDGIRWIKYPNNPVYSRFYTPFNTSNDNDGPWAPDVVFNKQTSEYMMWYEGTSGFQLATSPRNILFSSNCIVTASNDTMITSNDTISLFASGGIYYQWNPTYGLNNPNIANPIASPDSTTIYTVLAVSNNCITTDTVKITVTPSMVVQNISKGNLFDIFPNPAANTVSLRITNTLVNGHGYELKIFDMIGSVVFQKTSNLKPQILNLDLPNGIYFLQIKSDDFIQTKKIEIIR
ncbi:MAG: T9SS type A sorting domain-containing protein [Bacteroidota bacterium]